MSTETAYLAIALLPQLIVKSEAMISDANELLEIDNVSLEIKNSLADLVVSLHKIYTTITDPSLDEDLVKNLAELWEKWEPKIRYIKAYATFLIMDDEAWTHQESICMIIAGLIESIRQSRFNIKKYDIRRVMENDAKVFDLLRRLPSTSLTVSLLISYARPYIVGFTPKIRDNQLDNIHQVVDQIQTATLEKYYQSNEAVMKGVLEVNHMSKFFPVNFYADDILKFHQATKSGLEHVSSLDVSEETKSIYQRIITEKFYQQHQIIVKAGQELIKNLVPSQARNNILRYELKTRYVSLILLLLLLGLALKNQAMLFSGFASGIFYIGFLGKKLRDKTAENIKYYREHLIGKYLNLKREYDALSMN